MAALGLSFVVFGLCQESCVEKRLQRDHNPPQEIMRRLVEAVAPARMGTGFRWLLSAEWFNNLGDGMALAAGPLLIASQTRNPTLVALATIMQRAPWFLFGLYAGWIADRFDRRLMVAIADAFRGVVLVGLAAVIATGEVNVPLVLVAMFLLGTAETFADTAAGTLMPMLVTPRDLGVANARVSFGRRALNELVGPPLGAALFIGGLAVPFMVQAVMVGVGAVLVSRIAVGVPADLEVSRGIRTDVREGVLWLWRNPPVRTLTLTIVLFNLTFGAMWPMLVLYSDERLGLGEFGFGLLLSASAVGGVLGAMSYGWLEQRIALGTLMRSALLYETCMHLGLGLSTVPVISMATALWIRLSDLDLGFHGHRRPSAGRARELPRPSWQRVHGRTVRRPRSRRNDRCSRRWYLGSAGAVLVRVRWFGTQPGDCLAATTQGRSRRCADRGRI